MSENIALYRKYRPETFKDVKGQDHIVTVLEGAIKKDNIPHAILFAGGRGTGKTTLARIFAKEIGVKAVDVYEIDAASNRGIDDVRALREAVHTMPYESKRKVYIIDEIHMLTKEAFNALLKTLEEPPAHVIFILATTEPDRLLDTILSRCQIFTMRQPSREMLNGVVTEVAKKEGFKLSHDAADLIAIAADGSFRDALGITQKVILASGDTIGGADEVAEIIGAPKLQILEQLVTALNTKDAESAIKAINEAVVSQVDMKLFVRLLLERLRAVILLRNAPGNAESILANFSATEAERLQSLASESVGAINSHLLMRFLTAAEQTGKVPLPQLPLELAVIETCQG